jgi:hypothetical protein
MGVHRFYTKLSDIFRIYSQNLQEKFTKLYHSFCGLVANMSLLCEAPSEIDIRQELSHVHLRWQHLPRQVAELLALV